MSTFNPSTRVFVQWSRGLPERDRPTVVRAGCIAVAEAARPRGAAAFTARECIHGRPCWCIVRAVAGWRSALPNAF